MDRGFFVPYYLIEIPCLISCYFFDRMQTDEAAIDHLSLTKAFSAPAEMSFARKVVLSRGTEGATTMNPMCRSFSIPITSALISVFLLCALPLLAQDSLYIDEATDTYDTVEWLLKNIPNNNGRVGITGISYPGFYSTMGSIDAHPAVVATSPQAPVADWFIGDDFHQSTWFPLVDRNPQTFVDINNATESDFRKATHRVYHSPPYSSHLKLLIQNK